MKDSNYYKWATFRRRTLDVLQEEYKYLYKGVVLDIGGRDRGRFKKPKNKVKNWIFADINPNHNPDIILDVTDMKQIESNSINVVNAIELFEHVLDIEKGLQECFRVLKNGGKLIISIPFLYHIHADPFDFQRWTYTKWIIELRKVGFKIEKLIIIGKFFTHLSETIKTMSRIKIRSFFFIRRLLSLISPLLDKLILLDNKSFVKNDPILNMYHNGYFIIAKK